LPPVEARRIIGRVTTDRVLVELSHVIEDGIVTYPGLPGPVIGDHLSWDDSHDRYAPGTEFRIGRIEMVANTGTYLDTPAHRFRDGFDLSGLPLRSVADLPGVVVDAPGRSVDIDSFEDVDVEGRAVLLRTGWDAHWATDRYGDPDHPFLTGAAARHLAEAGAALVGIDSVNVDDTAPASVGARPAHTELLGRRIPVLEHLCGLDQLHGEPFRLFAVPPMIRGLATFPVRAFAIVGG
jgi:kynurenine formamidase